MRNPFKHYKAAAKMSRTLIEQESPEDVEHLVDTQVVVVNGCYDKGEQVFGLCSIPHSTVDPDRVASLELKPDQILFVNCPGQIPPRGLEKLKSFVNQGGMLVTTDWALKHVVEAAFPGYVEYNDRATADDVVRVVFEKVEDTFLEGLLDPNDDPLWWLEGSSYPIRILNEDAVKVLVSSREMGEKYGETPIVVAFEVGEGKIYHLTSHFYLQRTETRTQRHSAAASGYCAQKGVSMDCFDESELEALGSSNVTEVQAAYTSARSLTNLVIEQGRRVKARKAKK